MNQFPASYRQRAYHSLYVVTGLVTSHTSLAMWSLVHANRQIRRVMGNPWRGYTE